jgi:L-asparagine transporter-like permease
MLAAAWKGWVPVLAAVTTVFFSLVGAEITTVAAAESVNGSLVLNSKASGPL